MPLSGQPERLRPADGPEVVWLIFQPAECLPDSKPIMFSHSLLIAVRVSAFRVLLNAACRPICRPHALINS